MDKELLAIEKEIEKRKNQEDLQTFEPLNTPNDIVDKQLKDDLKAISEDKTFKNASMELTSRDVHAKLREKALGILSAEQQNDLSEYALKKEKERLDYRARYERNIDKEEVRAEVYKRKQANAEARFGYLYQQEIIKRLDKNGEEVQIVQYKNFTTNKAINRFRELVNWYKSLQDTTRKLIFATVKMALFIGLFVGLGFGLYGIIKWIMASGIIL